jgi:hypothetical protein
VNENGTATGNVIVEATTKEDGAAAAEMIIESGLVTLSANAAAEAKAGWAPAAKNDTRSEKLVVPVGRARKRAGGSAENGMTGRTQASTRGVYDRRRLLAEDRLPLRRRHSHQARRRRTIDGGAGDMTRGIETATICACATGTRDEIASEDGLGPTRAVMEDEEDE